MTKKILIVCPEIPNIGGAGKFLWDLAVAGSQYSNWETHLLTPMSPAVKSLCSGVDFVHEVPGKARRHWDEPLSSDLIKRAAGLHELYTFDMVYIISEMSMLRGKEFLKTLPNVIFGVHSQQYYFTNLNKRQPILPQLKGLKINKSFKELEAVEDCASLWHLISKMEEKIWTTLHPEKTNYEVVPDMILGTPDFGLPFSERSDDILFSGRVTGYAKGLYLIRKLLSANPEKNFVVTVPRNSLARALKMYKEYKNCKVIYFKNHDDVLKEMGRHKVFVNPGTYGPFDLTIIEAIGQGCQVVSGNCIGANDYFPEVFIPKDYTLEAFEEQIEKALNMEDRVQTKYPNMETSVQDLFDLFYRRCQSDRRIS